MLLFMLLLSFPFIFIYMHAHTQARARTHLSCFIKQYICNLIRETHTQTRQAMFSVYSLSPPFPNGYDFWARSAHKRRRKEKEKHTLAHWETPEAEESQGILVERAPPGQPARRRRPGRCQRWPLTSGVSECTRARAHTRLLGGIGHRGLFLSPTTQILCIATVDIQRIATCLDSSCLGILARRHKLPPAKDLPMLDDRDPLNTSTK